MYPTTLQKNCLVSLRLEMIKGNKKLLIELNLMIACQEAVRLISVDIGIHDFIVKITFLTKLTYKKYIKAIMREKIQHEQQAICIYG